MTFSFFHLVSCAHVRCGAVAGAAGTTGISFVLAVDLPVCAAALMRTSRPTR